MFIAWTINFFHKTMTDPKKIVLEHKGIELAYLEINSQKSKCLETP